MGKPNSSDECKRDAVAQITERGYPVTEVSQRRGALLAIGCLAACTILPSGSVLRAQAVGAEEVAPVDRLSSGWWSERHREILAKVAQRPDPELVLLGDSITQNYEKSSPPDEDFAPIWNQFYAPRRALNLGFSGDATNNLLWRLQHGEVQGLHPKAALILIGTNDTASYGRSAEQTLNGIGAVVSDLKQRLPETRILLLGILPSAVSSAKSATDAAVNRQLALRYRHDPRVRFLDIGEVFLKPDKTIDTAIFYDPRLSPPRPALHPDSRGQRRMAEAIEPVLAKLLAGNRGNRHSKP